MKRFDSLIHLERFSHFLFALGVLSAAEKEEIVSKIENHKKSSRKLV